MKKFFNSALAFCKKHLTVIIILFIFVFLFVCDNSSLFSGSFIMNNLKSIATSFTPTTDLFDDGSEVSFVSYFFGMKTSSKEDNISFFYPTSQPNISSSEEFLSYNFDGTIKSVAKGQISAIGYTKDNQKYVELQLNKGYIVRYVGLKNVGVSIGQSVEAGNLIGLVSSKENVIVYVHQNGNIVKISEIVWKN